MYGWPFQTSLSSLHVLYSSLKGSLTYPEKKGVHAFAFWIDALVHHAIEIEIDAVKETVLLASSASPPLN